MKILRNIVNYGKNQKFFGYLIAWAECKDAQPIGPVNKK